ncbi:MAG TPA: hypothetical protein EYP98_18400 [Planctomycetes bacterium]|nr:hypothetical protein [Planctomycetota bacterium]
MPHCRRLPRAESVADERESTNDKADDLIDKQLREAFKPPPAEHYGEVASGVTSAPRPLWMWLAAAAAALLLVLFALDDGRGPRGPEGHDGRQISAMWVARGVQEQDCVLAARVTSIT